jgi:hypothetical protein
MLAKNPQNNSHRTLNGSFGCGNGDFVGGGPALKHHDPSNGTVAQVGTLIGVLVLTQQNILNARSGGANQITQVVNFDATEIGAVKVKWWPSFKRDVL